MCAPSNITASVVTVLVFAACGCSEGAQSGPTPIEERPPGVWYDTRFRQEASIVPSEELEEMRRLGMLGYAEGYDPAEGAGEVGVLVLDPERAEPGLNLYSSGHGATAYLTELDGTVVHRWSRAQTDIEGASHLVGPIRDLWRRLLLLPDGSLVAIYEGLGVVCLDVDSRVKWYVENGAHHDLCLAPSGNVLVLARRSEHIPKLSRENVLEDFVVELDVETGREVRRVSILRAVWNSKWEDVLREAAKHGGDALHANSIAVFTEETAGGHTSLRPGTWLVSLRNVNGLVAIDSVRQRAVWFRRGAWNRQHDARPLVGGDVLLFDNMGNDGFSRVLQLDPDDGTITWSWAPEVAEEFFSVLCGASRRLAGGNTLVTESCAGRAFELTPEGDVVWSFASPHRAGERDHLIAVLYEVLRVPRPAWLR